MRHDNLLSVAFIKHYQGGSDSWVSGSSSQSTLILKLVKVVCRLVSVDRK